VFVRLSITERLEVLPSVIFKTFRLDLYEEPEDWFRLALEVLFLLILMQMIFREIAEMRSCYLSKKGIRKYFSSGWNWNELINISLFLAGIGVYLNYLIKSRSHPEDSAKTYSPLMEQVASRAWTYYNIAYFNILLTCFQTFKYLRMNRRLYMLWKTLQHAATNLFGFLFIFLIFVFGFVFLAWLTFGGEMLEFSTFNLSFGTCWNFLIGNPPDYSAMVQTNPIIGPIFFTLFTIFIFFILANMFIAIIANSFSVVSKSTADQMGIGDAIKEKLSGCFKSSKKIVKKFAKRSQKTKRSMLEILESLSYPEMLEKPGLTIDDVYRACGPDTTEAEAWELFEWIEKLESKKKQQTWKAKKTEDFELTDDEGISMAGTEMKFVPRNDYLELLTSIDALRDDMQRLLQLVPQPQLPPGQQPPQASHVTVAIDPPPVQDHGVPQPQRESPRPHDSVGPPPPTPNAIPPIPFSVLLQQQTPAKPPASRARGSTGPPPPIPPLARRSSVTIPMIPPPPHDHEHRNAHANTHAHDQHHNHTQEHAHTHGHLQVLHPASLTPHDRSPTPDSSTPNSSPTNSAPPSPTTPPRRSPRLPIPSSFSGIPLLVLDPSPRHRAEL
jgi:uncharacterized protein Yka (UPF0111/DUF47 family)